MQILRILKGEKDAEETVNYPLVVDSIEMGNQDEDDLYPEFSWNRQSESAMLRTENDNKSLGSGESDTCLSNAKKFRHFKLKDYLKKRQD